MTEPKSPEHAKAILEALEQAEKELVNAGRLLDDAKLIALDNGEEQTVLEAITLVSVTRREVNAECRRWIGYAQYRSYAGMPGITYGTKL